MFVALAFCETGDVTIRFNTLADEFIRIYGSTDQHEQFLDYFETTWVGRSRLRPRFSQDMWNCKQITENDLPRTNNSVESWHNAFQGALGCQHPAVYKLMKALQSEQVGVNALYVKLMAGEKVPLYARKEYGNANQDLLTLIGRYSVMTPSEHVIYFCECSRDIGFKKLN
ncbi:hypothetical protein QR680_013096 [Steinernema hermaphroditum]|uniref:MULE transposase domain-containing protein n=1 Tax=Steinernema hermaphroditum TaxID=289476 RepID=A0AA39I6X6_9BILA|nr:hypothetical protein QR680_013096 [Steinernema hermaphroditum]